MNIFNLPLDVLDPIIWNLVPEGLEGFALTCKTAYALSARQIVRHNALKERWHHTVRNSVEPGDLLHLLWEFARDPLVPRFIASLDMEGRGYLASFRARSDPRPLVKREDFLSDEAMKRKVELLLKSSSVLANAGVDPESWWRRILKENGPESEMEWEHHSKITTSLSLLLFLPNLKRLKLAHGWQTFDTKVDKPYQIEWSAVLESLVTSANNCNLTLQPLSRLESLLPFSEPGYDNRPGLQSVGHFLVLRNLTNVQMVSCVATDDGYTGHPFRWLDTNQASRLQRLELTSCCMDANAIAEILSNAPDITHLKYSHEEKWHGCLADWDAAAFVGAIATHGKKLRDLSLSLASVYTWVFKGVSKEFLDFTSLTSLVIDIRLFCGPPVSIEQSRSILSHINNPAPDVVEGLWQESSLPRLIEILPSSLISIQVDTSCPVFSERPFYKAGTAFNALVDNFAQNYGETLHNLQSSVVKLSDNRAINMFDAEELEKVKSQLLASEQELSKR